MKKLCAIMTLLLCGAIAYAQSGVVKELTGTVELKKPGAANFVPAKAGDSVTRDTVVSTGFKSSTTITVGSSTIVVRPLTRLTLAELSAGEGTETTNVSLQTGRVRVDVNPPAGTKADITVRGPSATASVRGTGFDFDTRNLTVRHGKVAFQGNKGGVQLVGAGSSSTVDTSGKAADPIVTTTASLTPPPPTAGAASSTPVVKPKPLPTLAEFDVQVKFPEAK